MYRIALIACLLLGAGTAAASAVSGQVVDQTTQQPIAGAEVSISYPGVMGWPTEIARATTGADGRYSVQFQYDGSVAGIARTAGYAARTQDGVPCTESPACAYNSFFPLAGGSATADFALSRAARLSGMVRDGETGQPVGSASFYLASTTSAHLTYGVHSDAAGRFSLEGLHSGSYTLSIYGAPVGNDSGFPRKYLNSHWPQFHCDNVQLRCDSVVPGQITVTEGQAVDIDVPLRRGSYLRTRVISDGNGLPTFIHSASARSITQPPTGVSGTDGDDDGYTWVGPLLPGPAHVVLESGYSLAYADVIYPNRTCPSSGCDFSGADVVEVPATDGIYTLDDVHVQPLRTIGGRVTASNGEPIAGLRIDAGTIGAPAHHAWGFRSTATTLTNADGEYRLEGFAGTEVVVRTRQNGLGWLDKAWQNEDCDAANLFCQSTATEPDMLAFAQQPHPAGIDFVLQRGASLRGRVIEAGTNRPLANHAVAVVPLDVLRVGKPVYTDTNGEFRIDGLTAHGYFLFASPEYVYGNTHGILYPDQPCTMSVLPNGTNTCFPTTQAPLQLAAGTVIAGLTIVVPRPDALFADRFGG